MTTYRGCRPNSTKMVPAGRQRVWLAAVLLALAALLSEPALSHGAGVGGSSATSTQSTAKAATPAHTGLGRPVYGEGAGCSRGSAPRTNTSPSALRRSEATSPSR